MEKHAILWVCDRGSAQENERAKSGFIVPVLLDFTNKGIILACADGVLIFKRSFCMSEMVFDVIKDIFVGFVSGVAGGFCYNKVCNRKSIKQIQKAGNNSKQIQVGDKSHE